jgi:DNA mismatch repair ATPase MutS
MGARDDLAAGTSLYRAEVDRIHALVERAGGDGLFLLDEAFRGTNPHERIAASAAVLRSLAARSAPSGIPTTRRARAGGAHSHGHG